MNKHLELVKEFHQTFQAPVLEKPQIPPANRCELRISLLQEELNELKSAINDNNLIEIIDAFGDILFVLNGSILEFGMGDIFDDAFAEISRSNMSKACSSVQEALATLSHYKQKDGTEGYYKEVNGKYIVYRNGDDKVLKSINYSAANLSKLIN